MIEFQKVFYKNFLSVGNMGLTIELNRSPTTLVGGKNGAGKSTLLEAIVYCLFGKTLKKIVLSGLVNSTNNKGTEVTVWFKKNGKDYRIVRGQKPNKLEFYIDDELQNQDGASKDYQTKIEYVLGMDYKLFTQVTILNKERYVPFMEMSSGERRKVVEDILDISVFSTMSTLLKEEMKTLSSDIEDLKYERGRIDQKIVSQQRLIDDAQTNLDERRSEIQESIDNALKKSKDLYDDILLTNEKIKEIGDPSSTLKKGKERKSEFDKIAVTFSGKMKLLEEKIVFFSDNDHCPVCKQGIDEGFKEKEIKEAKVSSDQIKANVSKLIPELQKVIDLNKELEAQVDALKDLSNDLRVSLSQKTAADASIKDLKRRLSLIVDNPKLDEYQAEYALIEAQGSQLDDNLREKISEEEVLKLVRDFLKDEGIKSSIVEDYIGFINIRLNEYLNSMNFFINITLNPNFEEKINSINREKFTIDNLSTGQKCRVNLAVWMALLEVSSLKNSAVTNLICLDEVLENLDANGVEDFMKLVKDKLAHKNIFVVTQRFAEFQDHFRSSIEFQLNQDQFTEIV